MSERLRVVAFTSGPLGATNRKFYERLAGDATLELCGIVVDGWARPKKPLRGRILQGLKQDGWAWLWFKAVTLAQGLGARVATALIDRGPAPASMDSYATLTERTAVPVYHVADIHADDALRLIRSLRPHLGIIVGGRILRESVLSIPAHGTLNIHKRRVPDYRGGGPVGYWEVLAGEPSIGVTIHFATSRVDEGDVMAEATIAIEDCDTLASLRIKADLMGARLYHDVVRRVAAGERHGRPQDTRQGRTYKAPSPFKVWRLERRLRRHAARRMPAVRTRPSALARARVLLQFALLSPLLASARRRLAGEGRSPVCILFYHLVANRPLNHMCLPLEDFVDQVEFLRRHHALLSLDDAVARLRGPGSAEVAVALTFDDGYRDNVWAIEYLRYFEIPAAFFVSIGHVRDGSPFAHDLGKGYTDARPMDPAMVQELAADGFLIGSHGLHHEDLGALEATEAERVLVESRRLIGELVGSAPEHFSFPKGQRGVNIKAGPFAAANRHYRFSYSAYGGYNFPGGDAQHFVRMGNPATVLELAWLVAGYTGLRACLAGNAWGLKTASLLPYAENP